MTLFRPVTLPRSMPAARAAGLLLALVLLAPSPTPRSRRQESPLLQAMRDELTRAMTGLRIAGQPAPYYIAYTLEDVAGRHMQATLGALVGDGRRRSRTVRVDVRVGDYARDSSRFVSFDRDPGVSSMYAMGVVEAPLDDDVAVLRRQLWLVTDAAYRKALATFAKKQAALQNQASPDPVPDWSRETPQTTRLPVVAPDVSADAWLAHVRTLSERAGPARADALRGVAHADAGHALQRQQRRVHDGGADPVGAAAAVRRDPGRGRHAAARHRDRARADRGRAARAGRPRRPGSRAGRRARRPAGGAGGGGLHGARAGRGAGVRRAARADAGAAVPHPSRAGDGEPADVRPDGQRAADAVPDQGRQPRAAGELHRGRHAVAGAVRGARSGGRLRRRRRRHSGAGRHALREGPAQVAVDQPHSAEGLPRLERTRARRRRDGGRLSAPVVGGGARGVAQGEVPGAAEGGRPGLRLHRPRGGPRRIRTRRATPRTS